MRALIAAGIETSIHTLLHRGFHLNLTEWIEFLAGEGVHKVSFMTFVPRGQGNDFKDQWMFSDSELQELSDQVSALGRPYRESIIVRYLDFARKPYLVFETDGRLGWQVAEESGDWPLLQVPVRAEKNNSALTTIQGLGVTNLVNIGQASLRTQERSCL